MGVDASIFARKANKRLYFDRLYNIQSYRNIDNLDPDKHIQLENIFCKLARQGHYDLFGFVKPEGYSTKEEVLTLMQACIDGWMLEPEERQYHAFWPRHIQDFVNSIGEDEFFVMSDNECEYYDLVDKYITVKPNE